MGTELRLAGAFALSLLVAAALLPVAIQVARRMGFMDRPLGWKTHLRPTPTLGGSAVAGGVVLAILAFTGDLGRTWPILAGAIVLWAVGAVDDRVQLRALPRVIVEGAVAAGIWAADLGWALPIPDVANLALTVLWVVGVINAFNYLDLMDGVAAATAIAIAAPAAVLANVEGDPALAVCALAVAGACCAFLPFNLSSPPRTFLGDGGTMPIGLILAVVTMVPASGEAVGWPALLGAACLVGVPLLDMATRLVLRVRDRRPLIIPGHDSAADRLLPILRGPGWVALTLGLAQLAAGLLMVAALESGTVEIEILFGVLLLTGVTAAALVHSRSPLPESGPPQVPEPAPPASAVAPEATAAPPG